MAEEFRDHLEQAAASTYPRIERDLERASPEAKRILRLIRDNLFHPELDVGRIRRTLGLRSNDATTRFRREIGEPIKRYIISRRLEVACRLLVRTRLATHEIARGVGWRAFKGFSHTFNKRLGCRPRAYRASGGRLSQRPPGSPRQEPLPARRRGCRASWLESRRCRRTPAATVAAAGCSPVRRRGCSRIGKRSAGPAPSSTRRGSWWTSRSSTRPTGSRRRARPSSASPIPNERYAACAASSPRRTPRP